MLLQSDLRQLPFCILAWRLSTLMRDVLRMSRSFDEVPPTHLWITMQREVHFAFAVLFMRTIEANPAILSMGSAERNVAPHGTFLYDFLERIDGIF